MRDKIVAFWSITGNAPHYYQVNIVKNGVYEGIGRFCESRQEFIDFCNYHHVNELRQRRY